jgi:hypothetical protein
MLPGQLDLCMDTCSCAVCSDAVDVCAINRAALAWVAHSLWQVLQKGQQHSNCSPCWLLQVVRPLPGNLLLPFGWGSARCIEADVDTEFIAGEV